VLGVDPFVAPETAVRLTPARRIGACQVVLVARSPQPCNPMASDRPGRLAESAHAIDNGLFGPDTYRDQPC
jgi:hypothetical protein